ncbi:MAG: FadR family transcriptional regulator [Pseudomonadales bacterium]|nr:FadR family transcriptional regulator [Pseudomonadales bacterium]
MPELKKYEDIASQIRALIEQGNLEAGARLPTERELAESFDVSRATIRQAEIQLQALGVLEIKTGSGAYVVGQATGSGSDEVLPEMTALELTEARSLLESEAAALAAVHITDAELAKLQECIEVMNRALPDNDEAADSADRDFHLVIAGASRNTAILHTVQMFWRMRNEIESVKRVYKAVCLQDTGPRGKEHSDILNALRLRDPMEARVAMRAHFFRLLESMLDVSTAQAIEAARKQADEERQRFLMNPAVRNIRREISAK